MSIFLILTLQFIFVAGWMFFVVDAFRTQPLWVGLVCLCTPIWIYYGLVQYDGKLKWWILGAAAGAQVVSGALVQTYGS
jgi:hypothetical protein